MIDLLGLDRASGLFYLIKCPPLFCFFKKKHLKSRGVTRKAAPTNKQFFNYFQPALSITLTASALSSPSFDKFNESALNLPHDVSVSLQSALVSTGYS